MSDTTAAAPEAETESTSYDFDTGFQRKIIALSMRDPVFMAQTDGLIKPEYFTEEVDQAVISMTLDFYKSYRSVPNRASIPTMLKDGLLKKKIRKDIFEDVKKRVVELIKTDVPDVKFVTEKVEDFAQERAMEEAVMKAVDLMSKGDIKTHKDKIKKLVMGALEVGVQDEGEVYDYWEELENRTTHRAAIKAGLIKPDGITTGNDELDDVLNPHKGWGREELSLLMGAAKSGKSMALAEFAKCASLDGCNVIYFTLENSNQITADRIDANLSDTMVKELTLSPNAVKAKIQALNAKAGAFKIVRYPSGTMKPSMMRRVLEKDRNRGRTYDLIVVDYADIMAPDHFTDNAIENSKSIYLALRGTAQEYKAAVLTATQTNREGAKKDTARATDVAEDFNRVRIADLIITINASDEEVKAGEARLFFAAMRNAESGFTLNIKQERSRMRFLKKVIGRS
jgi:replicative DNA helicase